MQMGPLCSNASLNLILSRLGVRVPCIFLWSINAVLLVAHPSRRVGESGGSGKVMLLFAFNGVLFLVVGLD